MTTMRMNPGRRSLLRDAAWFAAVLFLPLLGAALAGRDLAPLFSFPPPLEIPHDFPGFSWLATLLVVLVLAALLLPWLGGSKAAPPARIVAARRPFPPWGWAAAGWTLLWWTLAWGHFAWFGRWQAYTFFPLWLGFTVTANALATARCGTCLMLRAPRLWFSLFALSAGFWWLFEWLNRFVRNWHYLGAADFGALGYAIHATICFSTVLPAVTAAAECFATISSLQSRLAAGPRWTFLARPVSAAVLLGAAMLALLGTGLRPQLFYAALWGAPLALMLGASHRDRRDTLPAELVRGDWRRAGTWMLAALLCGLGWELWNWRSLPKWIYTVPYVDRWHIFEMPLLGYAGYLPFGLECLLVVERVRDEITRFPPAPPDQVAPRL